MDPLLKAKLDPFLDNEENVKQITKLLENKALGELLDILTEHNNPTLVIPALGTGHDLTTVIALDSAKRAGSQEVIRVIKNIRNLKGRPNMRVLSKPYSPRKPKP